MKNVLPGVGILVLLVIAGVAANDMYLYLMIALSGLGSMASPSVLVMWFIESSIVSIVIFGLSLFGIIKLVGAVVRQNSVHKPNYELVKEPAQTVDEAPATNFDADEAFARYMNRRGNSATERAPSEPANPAPSFGRKGT